MDREDPLYPLKTRKKIRPYVILCYKNFGALCNFSHIGLGVSAINISKTLIAHGIRSAVWPILTVQELDKKLSDTPAVTHVVIGAIWIPTQSLAMLSRKYPRITFAINCHSNVGFLQAEPSAIRLLREAMGLEMGVPNFRLAGNSERFCNWVKDTFGVPCSFLPNLYFADEFSTGHSTMWNGGVLRIGVFGATRVYKNITCAVAAALEIAHHSKAETEIWINAGRSDGGGNGNVVYKAAVALTENIPGVTLKSYPWSSWPEFRRFVRSMHLLLQPSYTESFNMVTADGTAEGVPSVVSSAIEWAPHNWKADVDNVLDIAQTGRRLLHDPSATRDGLRALHRHNEKGIKTWKDYIRATLQP